jgi:Flp pilus assembly protein TadD
MNPLTVSSDTLFSVLASQTTQMESLSSNSLSKGIERFQSKDYEGAVREFKRSISYAPRSDNAVSTYDFMATAYLQMGRKEDAVNAYRNALSISPNRDDIQLKLGNLQFERGENAKAEDAYKAAVRLNMASTTNLYSLGQFYLATGRIGEAEAQFAKVAGIAPESYGGYYGLGQAHHQAGRNEQAVEQFNTAIEKNPDFVFAYFDLGSTYADMGRTEEAYDQVSILTEKNAALALDLNKYIYKVSAPEFSVGYGISGFGPTMGPNTPVSVLNTALSVPNASAEFSMNFIFSKQMDSSSVENPYNWSITRADGTISGGLYNWGIPFPSTEVSVPYFPVRVTYDYADQSAQVHFTLNQNSAGSGTIDPSHIVFMFSGKDAYGNAMDPKGDQYSGISLIV